MSSYILAIDQGTTGTTVSIINQSGEFIARANEEILQFYPQPGWVEHDPDNIWQSVEKCIAAALAKAGISGQEVVGIGITNQRETTLVWERKSGVPIYKAIVWQCRRTSATCDQLKKRGLERLIRSRTGLVIDPYFSASKIQWILKNVAGAMGKAQKGELAFGTVDTFLLWKMTGGAVHKTDVSNGSRTQLMNIKTAQWDDELLRLFAVPSAILPEIVSSCGVFGKTMNVKGLPDGIPISGVAGDQQAALFGQTCFDKGEAKCTFGTGSFILLNTGDKPIISKSGLLTTVAWRIPQQKKLIYALEGGAFVCGAAVQWLRDGLGIIKSSSEIEELAMQVKETDGVEFVPALTGLGAPYWNPHSRGLICGITRGTTRAHLARATLEAMALQNVDIFATMQKDLARRIKAIRVDGGAVSNNLLMQLQADYLGIPIIRPKNVETTSIGAAYLAGLGVGLWSSLEAIRKIWASDREFKVALSGTERKKRLTRWSTAVKRVL